MKLTPEEISALTSDSEKKSSFSPEEMNQLLAPKIDTDSDVDVKSGYTANPYSDPTKYPDNYTQFPEQKSVESNPYLDPAKYPSGPTKNYYDPMIESKGKNKVWDQATRLPDLMMSELSGKSSNIVNSVNDITSYMSKNLFKVIGKDPQIAEIMKQKGLMTPDGKVTKRLRFDILDAAANLYSTNKSFWDEEVEKKGEISATRDFAERVTAGVLSAAPDIAEFAMGPAYAGLKGAVEAEYQGKGIGGQVLGFAKEAALWGTMSTFFKALHPLSNQGVIGQIKQRAYGAIGMTAEQAGRKALEGKGLTLEEAGSSLITGVALAGGKKDPRLEAMEKQRDLIKSSETATKELSKELSGLETAIGEFKKPYSIIKDVQNKFDLHKKILVNVSSLYDPRTLFDNPFRVEIPDQPGAYEKRLDIKPGMTEVNTGKATPLYKQIGEESEVSPGQRGSISDKPLTGDFDFNPYKVEKRNDEILKRINALDKKLNSRKITSGNQRGLERQIETFKIEYGWNRARLQAWNEKDEDPLEVTDKKINEERKEQRLTDSSNRVDRLKTEFDNRIGFDIKGDNFPVDTIGQTLHVTIKNEDKFIPVEATHVHSSGGMTWLNIKGDTHLFPTSDLGFLKTIGIPEITPSKFVEGKLMGGTIRDNPNVLVVTGGDTSATYQEQGATKPFNKRITDISEGNIALIPTKNNGVPFKDSDLATNSQKILEAFDNIKRRLNNKESNYDNWTISHFKGTERFPSGYDYVLKSRQIEREPGAEIGERFWLTSTDGRKQLIEITDVKTESVTIPLKEAVRDKDGKVVEVIDKSYVTKQPEPLSESFINPKTGKRITTKTKNLYTFEPVEDKGFAEIKDIRLPVSIAREMIQDSPKTYNFIWNQLNSLHDYVSNLNKKETPDTIRIENSGNFIWNPEKQKVNQQIAEVEKNTGNVTDDGHVIYKTNLGMVTDHGILLDTIGKNNMVMPIETLSVPPHIDFLSKNWKTKKKLIQQKNLIQEIIDGERTSIILSSDIVKNYEPGQIVELDQFQSGESIRPDLAELKAKSTAAKPTTKVKITKIDLDINGRVSEKIVNPKYKSKKETPNEPYFVYISPDPKFASDVAKTENLKDQFNNGWAVAQMFGSGSGKNKYNLDRQSRIVFELVKENRIDNQLKISKNNFDISGMRTSSGKDLSNTGPEDYGKKYSGWLGNPHKANDIKGGEGNVSREEAIELFRKDFYRKIDSDPEFKKAVEDLRGKTLGYYRPDLPNHLDVVKDYLSNKENKPIQTEIKKERSPEIEKITVEKFRSKVSDFMDDMEGLIGKDIGSPYDKSKRDYEYFYVDKYDVEELMKRGMPRKLAEEKLRSKNNIESIINDIAGWTYIGGGIKGKTHPNIKRTGNYFDRIDIPEQWRKTGVGKRLVDLIEDEVYLEGHKTIYGLAEPQALGFWEKQGYKVVSKTPGEDNVMVEKDLTSKYKSKGKQYQEITQDKGFVYEDISKFADYFPPEEAKTTERVKTDKETFETEGMTTAEEHFHKMYNEFKEVAIFELPLFDKDIKSKMLTIAEKYSQDYSPEVIKSVIEQARTDVKNNPYNKTLDQYIFSLTPEDFGTNRLSYLKVSNQTDKYMDQYGKIQNKMPDFFYEQTGHNIPDSRGQRYTQFEAVVTNNYYNYLNNTYTRLTAGPKGEYIETTFYGVNVNPEWKTPLGDLSHIIKTWRDSKVEAYTKGLIDPNSKQALIDYIHDPYLWDKFGRDSKFGQDVKGSYEEAYKLLNEEIDSFNLGQGRFGIEPGTDTQIGKGEAGEIVTRQDKRPMDSDEQIAKTKEISDGLVELVETVKDLTSGKTGQEGSVSVDMLMNMLGLGSFSRNFDKAKQERAINAYSNSKLLFWDVLNESRRTGQTPEEYMKNLFVKMGIPSEIDVDPKLLPMTITAEKMSTVLSSDYFNYIRDMQRATNLEARAKLEDSKPSPYTVQEKVKSSATDFLKVKQEKLQRHVGGLRSFMKELQYYPDVPGNVRVAIDNFTAGTPREVQSYHDTVEKAVFGKLNPEDRDNVAKLVALHSDLRLTRQRVWEVDEEGNKVMKIKNVDIGAPGRDTSKILKELKDFRAYIDRLPKARKEGIINGKVQWDQTMKEQFDYLSSINELPESRRKIDYAPYFVKEYLPEWGSNMHTGLPGKGKFPFQGYLKQSHGTPRERVLTPKMMLDYVADVKHDYMMKNFLQDLLVTNDKAAYMSPEELKEYNIDENRPWGDHREKATINGEKYQWFSPDLFRYTTEFDPITEEQRIKGPKQTYLIPESLFKSFDLWSSYHNNIRSVNQAMRIWKGAAINANWLSYNFNNLIGDTHMSFLMHPDRIGYGKEISTGLSVVNKMLQERAGIEVKYEPYENKLKSFLIQHEILDSGQIWSEVATRVHISQQQIAHMTTGNKLKEIGKYLIEGKGWHKIPNFMREVSNYRESILRASNASYILREIDNGRSSSLEKKFGFLKSQFIDGASEYDRGAIIAKEFFVNYNRQSPTYRKYISGLNFPFGKWAFDMSTMHAKWLWKSKEYGDSFFKSITGKSPKEIILGEGEFKKPSGQDINTAFRVAKEKNIGFYDQGLNLGALPKMAALILLQTMSTWYTNYRDEDVANVTRQMPEGMRMKFGAVIKTEKSSNGSIHYTAWSPQLPTDVLIGSKMYGVASDMIHRYRTGEIKDLRTASKMFMTNWLGAESRGITNLINPIYKFFTGLVTQKDPYDGAKIYPEWKPYSEMSKGELSYYIGAWFAKCMIPLMGTYVGRTEYKHETGLTAAKDLASKTGVPTENPVKMVKEMMGIKEYDSFPGIDFETSGDGKRFISTQVKNRLKEEFDIPEKKILRDIGTDWVKSGQSPDEFLSSKDGINYLKSLKKLHGKHFEENAGSLSQRINNIFGDPDHLQSWIKNKIANTSDESKKKQYREILYEVKMASKEKQEKTIPKTIRTHTGDLLAEELGWDSMEEMLEAKGYSE